MIVAMPRDGGIIFADLIGKLDVLRVTCNKCGRDGGLARLMISGARYKAIDWLAELTALSEEASPQWAIDAAALPKCWQHSVQRHATGEPEWAARMPLGLVADSL
jgi:hypothetical protein